MKIETYIIKYLYKHYFAFYKLSSASVDFASRSCGANVPPGGYYFSILKHIEKIIEENENEY